jgi:hypothetical protein
MTLTDAIEPSGGELARIADFYVATQERTCGRRLLIRPAHAASPYSLHGQPPGPSHVDAPDQFSHVKQRSTAERDAMIANFKMILADFDADGDGDGDGRLSRDEAPLLLKAQFDRYDTDHDGFITLDDAQGWD